MNWLTRVSTRNGVAVAIVALLVTVGGLWSVRQLKQETMPDVSVPIVAVMTVYPGASPADVLEDVTKPVEDSLSSVAGIKHVNSTSAENVSMVVAEFSFSDDMDAAQRRVSEAVGKVGIPETAEEPAVTRWSFGSAPILRVSVANGRVEPQDLESAVRDDVVPKLSGVEGVAQVTLASDAGKAVYVRLKPAALLAEGVTAEQVRQQLQAANLSYPVGKVELGAMSEPVRVSGAIADIEALERLRIPVQPDMSEMFADGMTAVGEGMTGLGEAVGAMGEGMGAMGEGMGGLAEGMAVLGEGTAEGMAGLGEGLAGATAGLSGQVALLQGIQQSQAGVFDMKLALADANAVLRDPNATPEDQATASATVAQLEPQIAGTEAAIEEMQAQLAAIQKEMAAASGEMPSMEGPRGMPSSSSGGLPEMPSSLSGLSGASMPEMPSVDPDEPIELDMVELGDVADITVGSGESSAISRTDGKPAVLLEISKGQDANTVDVADAVRDKLDGLGDRLPDGTRTTVTYDASISVRNSIGGIQREAMLGAAIAFLIILAFLRNFRATVIAGVAIPLSMLISFVFMRSVGVTLNIMTLGGLTVAIGRVVDDSIVVIENVFRHFQEHEGERTLDVIRRSVGEVAGPITSSTLTTCAVFIPLGLISGMVGKVFRPFAMTVAISLLASLFVSVTVAPLLAKWLLIRSDIPDLEGKRGPLAIGYERLIGWALRHKLAVGAVALAMTVAAGGLVPIVGTGFMPEQDEHYVNVDLTYPDGTKIGVVDSGAAKIEKAIAADDDAESFQTVVGSPQGENAMLMRGANKANIFVKLDDDADVDTVIARWRDRLEPMAPEDGISITEAGHEITGGTATLEVSVLGDDIGAVKAAAADITEELRGMDGLGEPSNNVASSKPEIAITVNQAEAARKALSAGQVAMTMRSLLAEEKVGDMDLDGEKLDLKVGLKLDPVGKVADLRAVELASPLGEAVALNNVAKVEEVAGPVSVYTRDGSQYAVVSADILDKDTGAVNGAVARRLDSMDLPEGVTTELSGTAAMMSESFNQMGLAMLIAIGAVYLVMVLAFGEAIAPLAIMFSLPLALIGGMFGLWIADETLNMPAMVGALMLIGLVVTNAIVLMDRVLDNRRAGMAVREALIEAGGVRLRPILMTALTTICALIPMGIGLSDGALMSRSLAAIVMGGLTTSTLLTLVVVPVVYEALDSLRTRLARSAARPISTDRPEPEAA